MSYTIVTEGMQRRLKKLAALRGASTLSQRLKAYDYLMCSDHPHELRRQTARYLVAECRDLYFWFTYILRRKDGRNTQYIEIGDETLEVDAPGWVYARCNELTDAPDEHLDLWAREHYKAECIPTPVPTPYNGWVKHGQLEPGDWVFGPDGQPTQVTARTRVFTDADCYRITFDDGTTNECSGDHLWEVQKKSRRRIPGTKNKRYKFDTMVLDTRALAAHSHEQDNRYSIATAAAVAYPTADLLVPPYTLGAWLGDGTTIVGSISKPDQFLFDRIADEDFAIGPVIGKERSGTRTVYGLQTLLKELGVFDNKHIPDDYLQAGIDQRIALLQGLMDTDGHCNTRGTATFVNTNERIVDGLTELCCSLGLKPHKRQYENEHGPWWQVSFQAYQEPFCPFSMPRKANRCKAGAPDIRRFITSVEPIEPIPCSCIEVAREDGLYLVGKEYLTTHNSSIGTFALTLMEVAINREITIGVFSFRSKSANDFISQFKAEMETNPLLHWLFPEVFWKDPQREAPQWSTQAGLTVKRTGNPRSATLEAHALEQGAPVGKHYDLMVYDDVVTRDSVIGDAPARTLVALELSFSLGKVGGSRRFYGTRYAYNDAYGTMIQRKVVKPRIHEAERVTRWCDIDTREEHIERASDFMPLPLLDKKRSDMGLVTYSCQMLLDPRGGNTATFNIQNLRYYSHQIPRHTVNVYIIVDPAKGKTKRPTRSDYTCMQVWAVGADRNYYLMDMIHDRLDLKQRTDALISLYNNWRPNQVGYEEYGMQADIEHIQEVCKRYTYNIPITALGGNKLTKEDRIENLIPYVDEQRIFLPFQLHRARVGEPGMFDLVDYMVNTEMANWPAVVHDDVLDAAARLTDPLMNIVFPELKFGDSLKDIYRPPADDSFDSSNWMAG